ncbi:MULTISPECIES: sensor histidine kinase [unclassified Flavobacterium]|uniref:sensor histidine kinase n=1 Tax=unclassified Flavobacterium TaxID=196869 RepID=UPI001E636714|nr:MULTISPECIES: histidine kinase [unclassified Flavobacterium]
MKTNSIEKISKRKNTFWIIQIVIWTIVLGFIFIPPMLDPKRNVLRYEKWQLVLDYVSYTVAILVVTYSVRFFFNKYIDFESFTRRDLFKIIVVFVISIAIYYSFVIGYNYLMLTYVYKRPEVLDHPSQSVLANIVFIILFSILFFLWIISYTVVKTILLLKDNKMNRLELESTLKESQINALKGQINPHFMFNSLNNIRGLILENPMKSREMITRLSEMLRYSLTKSEINTIALEEEIEMVENFIAISKIQLEDRLQFISEIEEETLKLPIPPMIIQMLIENAIKHGISQLKNGGILLLKIKKENTNLHIQVKNTGNLSQQTGTTQLGLKNIQRRLHLIYGENATFSLNEIENEVIAKITLPIS